MFLSKYKVANTSYAFITDENVFWYIDRVSQKKKLRILNDYNFVNIHGR